MPNNETSSLQRDRSNPFHQLQIHESGSQYAHEQTEQLINDKMRIFMPILKDLLKNCTESELSEDVYKYLFSNLQENIDWKVLVQEEGEFRAKVIIRILVQRLQPTA